MRSVVGWSVLTAILCTYVAAAEPDSSTGPILEPAVWQGPEFSAKLSTSGDGTATSAPTSAVVSAQATAPGAPPQPIVPPIIPPQNGTGVGTTPPVFDLDVPAQPAPEAPAPLLDGNLPAEELLPPVVDAESVDGVRRGVRPYGGGHPTDWSWGCGGSPYRTGPGLCDNWKVGPRWHITVDGITMTREETDLISLANQMAANDPTGIVGTPMMEQFDHGPGGRITFTSQAWCYKGYDLQAVYEGIENWDASIVYPKQPLDIVYPDPPTNPPTTLLPPFPEGTEQRSLHYYSSMHSGELNWVRACNPTWRPFCGVRYIQFDDSLRDRLDQQAQPPLPGPRADVLPVGPVTTTDRLNLFHVENNLMGFQVGLLHDSWRINNRFSFDGFVNGGVFYNHINYLNRMTITTTQVFADNTTTTTVDESRTDVSRTANNDESDLSEVSYMSEANLSAVCRLNKCWALRAGYQVLWINHLHTADSAFLGDNNSGESLLFHGWHAGVECRR